MISYAESPKEPTNYINMWIKQGLCSQGIYTKLITAFLYISNRQ